MSHQFADRKDLWRWGITDIERAVADVLIPAPVHFGAFDRWNLKELRASTAAQRGILYVPADIENDCPHPDYGKQVKILEELADKLRKDPRSEKLLIDWQKQKRICAVLS